MTIITIIITIVIMCRIENKTVSHIASNVRCLPKMNIKRGMTMYAGIFVGDSHVDIHVKNMIL